MALLDLFFKRSEEDSITEDTNTITDGSNENDVSDVLLRALLNGETITKDKALSIPAVSSSVDKISNSVAMLPVRLYKKENIDGKNKIIEIKNDIRTYLLNIDTGDTLDPFQLKKALVQDYLLDKGAFIYIEKYKNDFRSIRYVEPTQVSYIKNTNPIFKDAKYLVNGDFYDTYNFLSILRNTKDGITGKSLVDEVSKAVETAFTTLVYELGLVKKGGAKSGFLQSTKKLTQEAIDKLKKAWKELYSNSGENVVVLNDGIEFKESSNSSVELQLNERKNTLKLDIKDIFHISDDNTTYIKDAVMPVINAIESALNKNFLLEEEKSSFYFKFDISEIERGDPKARYENYKLAESWLSKNEIRYQENYEEIDGFDVVPLGLADVLYDINTKTYYTPNTGEKANMNGGGETDETTDKK